MSKLFALFAASCFLTVLPAPQLHAGASGSSRPGHLDAGGQGKVGVLAQGLVQIQLNGQGVLVIQKARSLKIALRGQGRIRRTARGDMVISQFTGRITIVGQRIQTGFRGGPISLMADGHGRAHFQGRGRYDANGNTGTWDPQGVRVRW